MVPIYEYQCDACGHKLEVMQRMNAERLKTCPSCEEDALKKLISKVDFRLKGTGWYETDFKTTRKTEESATQREDNGSKADDSSKPDDTKSSKSSSGSGDSTASQTTESTERSVSPKV